MVGKTNTKKMLINESLLINSLTVKFLEQSIGEVVNQQGKWESVVSKVHANINGKSVTSRFLPLNFIPNRY